ncbi:hypothetical protein EJ05DRAFT_492987 [Pseudovirgaria hyperparasitica]|uniref:Zn(2)-C6 fungal-type domain-containing protein n=1 Tax=Pseudovirgaria hyperparasitica TaxID=470096 RepID=A0A6A6W8R8_9PEZI|nr:uncharacterized protein EJ05DRAFT_492987 [Pseudovirgaria hyperparasitica]KAF2757967.1 hypothetical protein EJ05DRAFT_492987 [Pseudovirgaria hyperparasitica]
MRTEISDDSGLHAEGGDLDFLDQLSTRKDATGDDAPAWSEMKTKAGKERKRLPLACIACRRKKIRCSGEKPACKHCLRSRIPCVYKVTTRKAAPRTDYMAMLDKRLKRMEDRVIKLVPKENQATVAASGRSVVRPPIPTAPAKPAASKKRQAEEAFGNELDEWSKSRPTNPADLTGVKGQDADENLLLTDGAESLPSKELQEHLAEVYFDHVYGQSYPLLHKPSFMCRLSTGQVPPVLMLAVCAISARFSTHPSLRTEPAFLRGETYASKAREIALKRYDTPNITILIVYLLLGLHEFGTCQGGRSWMFGGMAQRMAYALQLHRDLDYDPRVGEHSKLSFTDREIRRRTMWSCFLMDRFNSSGTDRPLFVSEQFIVAQLPIKEHFFQMEIAGPTEALDVSPNEPSPSTEEAKDQSPKENMGAMAYMIRLVTIWGKVIKYINLGGKAKDPHPMWDDQSEFSNIKNQTERWMSDLPEALHYNEDNLQTHASERTANQFLYLHILYHQIILFMNRFALPNLTGLRATPEMPKSFVQGAAKKALDAANQISILINQSLDHNVTAPFAGYSAFFSSTVHVHGVFSKNPALEASSKNKMKKVWGMFHFVAENLKDLYRQHADANLRGAKAAKDNAPTIFQYGDWFDRYPHGVSKTDYEDPITRDKSEPGTDAVLGQKSELQTVEEFFATLSPPTGTEAQQKMAKKAKASKGKNVIAQNRRVSAQQPKPSANTTQRTQMPLPSLATDFDASSAFYQQAPTSAPVQQNRQGSSFDASAATAYLINQQLQQQHQHQQSPLSTHTPIDLSNHFPQLDPMTQAAMQTYYNGDLAPFGGGYGGGTLEPGNGWFMPFNVDPPDLGDDGIFSTARPPPNPPPHKPDEQDTT